MNVWEVLGIEETGDERAIKRAYAKRLKVTRPEDDPQAFQELREAYELAARMAAYARAHADSDHTEEPPPHAAPLDAPPVNRPLPDAPPPIAPPVTAPSPEAAPPNAPPRHPPRVNAPPVAAPAAAPATAPHEAYVSPVGVTVFHDDQHQPTATPPDARQAAERLWRGFVERAAVAPRHQLKDIAASDAMLSLDVRDYFELYAISYCATDACGDELRESIADHFGWADDMALVRRELPQQAAETVARLRAAESYRQFAEHARANPVTAALLAESPGPAFPAAWDRKFVFGMRELLRAVHWHHREMLHFKLNEHVVETWNRRVEQRRYFLQTALWSLAACFVLGLATLGIFEVNGAVEQDAWFAVGGVCAAVFAAGAGLERLLANATFTTWRDLLLHQWRYHPAVQFGWIGALAVLGLLFLIPAPSTLVMAPASVLAACCLAVACVANSAVLNGFAFTLSIAIGVALGAAFAAPDPDLFATVAYASATTAALQLFYRGGGDLWAWMNMPAPWITRMRVTWLGAAAVLLLLPGRVALPHLPLCVIAGAWALAGMLLSRPTFNLLYGLLASVLLHVILLGNQEAGIVNQAPLPQLFLLLVAIAIFMVVNMKRAAEHQHQFA